MTIEDVDDIEEYLTDKMLDFATYKLSEEGKSGDEIEEEKSKLKPYYHTLVEKLLKEAYDKGFPGTPSIDAKYSKPQSGSTAEEVVLISSSIHIVAKIDNEEKVAKEARTLRRIQEHPDIPAEFKKLFPKVYGTKEDEAPYAYLMEQFIDYVGFDEIVFDKNTNESAITSILHVVLTSLFKAYDETKNKRLRPSTDEIYFDRISARLQEAATLDSEFAEILKKKLKINGTTYEKCDFYLEKLGNVDLTKYEPKYSTFVHGDPNPENILVKREEGVGDIEIRFIDVKEWEFADYLWDVGKLAHYVDVTGRVEKNNGVKPKIDKKEEFVEIEYKLPELENVNAILKFINERTEEFARKITDKEWKTRFELCMASNLLGLPLGRLKKGKRDSAIILYAEGIRHLSKFYEMING